MTKTGIVIEGKITEVIELKTKAGDAFWKIRIQQAEKEEVIWEAISFTKLDKNNEERAKKYVTCFECYIKPRMTASQNGEQWINHNVVLQSIYIKMVLLQHVYN